MTSSEVAVERATKMLTASWRLSSRPCDSCSSSASVVFCRIDSAFLCLRCDSKIHGASTAHARVWVCEVCEQAPAAVTCRADAAALCGTCDADIHSANPLARRHDRVSIVPFHETPSTVRSFNPLFDDPVSGGGHPCGEEEEAEAASWLLLDPNPKVSEAADVESKEFCFSDPYADLEYPCLNDSVVPVQTKGFQVHQAFVPSSAENCMVELDFRRSKATATTYSAYATAQSLTQSLSSSSLDVGVVPDGNSSATTDVSKPFDSISSYKAGSVTVSGLDRKARVLRYREKRKNRKFQKTIRYASRKAYAETRPRIKGRFAKRAENNGDFDQIYSSSAAALVSDGGYGLVPSF
ncbi:hypothetical protein MRB53_017852 [Persea americana]|uniref:Uncharacterized protein n=1 Tax=Persea americana TaxID=3435 RepID=A0ACC2M6T0_PERAE|nr:hypothetical protein MRB53_017852 [Persea americana]